MPQVLHLAQRQRVPQLDALRGIAILMVIAHHYPYIKLMETVGWAGVDLFFVLSGFLISGLLFDDWQRYGRLRIWRFYVRRGFKIYPAFYVFLLFTIAFSLRHYDAVRHWHEVFFLQDYSLHVWPHTWSLAVEEHFYFVLPLVLLLLTWIGGKSDPFRSLPMLAAFLIVVCTILRITASGNSLLSQAHLRADALFLGVALGYLFRFQPDLFRRCSRPWLCVAAIPFLLPLAVYGYSVAQWPWLMTCNEIGFGLLLWWLVTRSYIRAPLLERIGFYSYSIYIWHVFVLTLFPKTRSPVLFVCANCLCIAVGIGAAKLVEMPALRLRDRITRPSAESKPGSHVPVTAVARPA